MLHFVANFLFLQKYRGILTILPVPDEAPQPTNDVLEVLLLGFLLLFKRD